MGLLLAGLSLFLTPAVVEAFGTFGLENEVACTEVSSCKALASSQRTRRHPRNQQWLTPRSVSSTQKSTESARQFCGGRLSGLRFANGLRVPMRS